MMAGNKKNIGENCLKERFPRLYFISSQKEAYVAKCGVWDGYSWNWNLLWRHQFFEWEYGEGSSAPYLKKCTTHLII